MGETERDQGAKIVPWVGKLLSKFVQNFAKIAKPLSDLLKKLMSEIWDEHCYHAFGKLKRCLTSAHVLKFSKCKSRLKCTPMRRTLRYEES